MNPAPHPAAETTLLKTVLLSQRSLYVRAAWLSLVIGMLMLTPSWFMFEAYGRVLNSRNERTLYMLLLAVVGLYIVMELLDIARSKVLHAASKNVDAGLRDRLFDIVFQASARRGNAAATQVFMDLKTVREFIPSSPVTSMMDLPAAFIFLTLLFVIGPLLGMMALVGALLQVGVAWSTERRTMPTLTEASKAQMAAQGYGINSLRNAEVIESMGMLGNIHKRWNERHRRFVSQQTQASDVGGLNAVFAKLIQTMQSSLLLGGACWMALHNDLLGGAGMMIVASILGARVLQPLAQLVAQWRTVVTVREAYQRLNTHLGAGTMPEPAMPLPPPRGMLTVEQLMAAPPGSPVPVLKGVSFNARPGEVLAIVGPSACGKTSLARLLVGVWPAASGKVRLDGVDVFSWNKAELGPHVGYLPQSVELFDGTVAENIARFGPVETDKVREAAQLVGMVEMIEVLPQGFDTRIGEDGAILSGGQRQRLALARAVYGNPRLVVLDEPNASLDEAGEKALLQMLVTLKSRGTTVLAITHRTTLLPAAERLLVMNDGQMVMFGPRDEVLAALKKGAEDARAKQSTAAAAGSALATLGAKA